VSFILLSSYPCLQFPICNFTICSWLGVELPHWIIWGDSIWKEKKIEVWLFFELGKPFRPGDYIKSNKFSW